MQTSPRCKSGRLLRVFSHSVRRSGSDWSSIILQQLALGAVQHDVRLNERSRADMFVEEAA